ncbi:glutamine synthetase family protein [Sandarakinorhabdus sp.]|uniref:glutamine synthetase family protein n=1 Tax=Sandarakinorhabdus sp. TaxID=1916663 RepID=UPI003F6F4C6F
MSVSIAPASECEAFLAANPHVDAIDMIFTNMAGVARGKRLRRHELLSVYKQGRFLPGSLLVNDIRGDDVPETGLVWEDGDADRLAWPVPGTLALTPQCGPGTAQLLTSLHELDGQPCTLDPRQILSTQIAALAARGLTPVVACELEFYLLDADTSTPRPANGASLPHVYGLAELAAVRPFLDAVNAAGDAAGIRIEAAITENAPGQMEIGLTHHADALRACDEAILFKRIIHQCAAAHGFAATFMAKPFADIAGSGMHIHISMLDAHGQNIFAADAPEGTPALQHAIAGLQALLPDSMAIFAPNMNSYRRLRPNTYAPTAATWGINNRTVALRIPAGPPASRHLEHRVSGADTNPYLAVAAVLAGVEYGLANARTPGPITIGNGYAAIAPERMLPTDWSAALHRFAASPPLRAALGDQVVDMFVAVKRHELEAYQAIVTATDHEWYLASS